MSEHHRGCVGLATEALEGALGGDGDAVGGVLTGGTPPDR